MMNNKMKKTLSAICAMGAAIVCFVMIGLEIMLHNIPALVWLAFFVFTFANFILIQLKEKPAFADEA